MKPTNPAQVAITNSATIGREIILVRPNQATLTDLLIASKQCRLGTGTHEFWGATADGKAWRVCTKGNP